MTCEAALFRRNSLLFLLLLVILSFYTNYQISQFPQLHPLVRNRVVRQSNISILRQGPSYTLDAGVSGFYSCLFSFESVRVVDARSSTKKRGVIGPLASQIQLEKVTSYIRKGIAEGARVVTGGLGKPENTPAGGYFVKPTVFANVHNQMTIAREEIFGPVLVLIPYDTEEEAIDIANDTIYGLNNAVCGKNETHCMNVASQLRSGQVQVNTTLAGPMVPFGGYKQSGDGREWGAYGLEEFLQVKAINRPKRKKGRPAMAKL